MNLQWFFSKTVRQATAMRKHVQKLINHQRDILAPAALEGINAANLALAEAVRKNADKAALEKEMEGLEKAANKWLKPYPNAGLRENIEVLLVALTVAMGIRTFFLQPFKIPTGSMQPTLFGITEENFIDRPDVKFPNPVKGFFTFWNRGISYTHKVAKAPGQFQPIDPIPKHLLLFNLYQRFRIGTGSPQ